MPHDTTKARPGNPRFPGRAGWCHGTGLAPGPITVGNQGLVEPFHTLKPSVDSLSESLGDMVTWEEKLMSCASYRPPMLNGLTGAIEVIGTAEPQE